MLGRPITLQGGEDRGWIPKTTAIQLQALVELPGKDITLVLGDGRQFQAKLDNSSGSAFELEPLFQIFPTLSDDVFIIKNLKFITA